MSECDNVSKQKRVSQNQHVEHLQLAVFSNPAKKPKSPARGQQKKNYGHKQLVMMREGLAFISNLNTTRLHSFFSFGQILVRCMHAAPGLFSWSKELLAFASRQFAPKIVDLLCPLHSHCFCFPLFSCEHEPKQRGEPIR